MSSNLRVRFRESQHKHLSKSIVVHPTPSKKACLELAYPKPVSVPPSAPVPSTSVVDITLESDEKLPFADDIAYHKTRKPFVIPDNVSEELFEFMTYSLLHPKSTYVPNQDEVSELLK